ERELLETIVAFHFSIYNVVSTQFFDPTGTIVFSYDDSEIGRKLDPALNEGLAEALAGRSYAERADIVADTRYASPSTAGASYTAAPATSPSGDHQHTAAGGAPAPALVHALKMWVPVREGGTQIGAAVTARPKGTHAGTSGTWSSSSRSFRSRPVTWQRCGAAHFSTTSARLAFRTMSCASWLR